MSSEDALIPPGIHKHQDDFSVANGKESADYSTICTFLVSRIDEAE